jgi:hypothetical protein
MSLQGSDLLSDTRTLPSRSQEPRADVVKGILPRAEAIKGIVDGLLREAPHLQADRKRLETALDSAYDNGMIAMGTISNRIMEGMVSDELALLGGTLRL